MVELDDWRRNGQEEYLRGAHLQYKVFELGFPGYDHDHCSFCFQKITCLDIPDGQKSGYATSDNQHWVCSHCFADFKEEFEWHLD